MSRLIKLRAWDTVRKVMAPIAYLNFGDEGLALTTTLKTAPKDIYDDERVAGESAILMQLIGLTDLRKKDVYEGDIITFRCEGCLRVHRAEIVWMDDLLCWGMNTDDGQHVPLFHVDEEKGQLKMMVIEQVIGNRYENPDLLS